MHRRLALLPLTVAISCGAQSSPSEPDEDLTYYRDAKAIIDARCATCHSPGNIGSFPLTTIEDVEAFAGPMRASIENGTMPPWQPSDACAEYKNNMDLSDSERDTLLAWLDAGAPAGDPVDAPQTSDLPEPVSFDANLSLKLPEPYTPTLEPDDYRCQLIPWPEEETSYVTGLRVTPDQRAIVHHVIVFVVGPEQASQYQAYDDAEDGPGYRCYGGPSASEQQGGLLSSVDLAALIAALEELGLTLEDLQSGDVTDEQIAALLEELGGDSAGSQFGSIGSWVPGAPAAPFPEDTGIRVEPGSMLVVQIHYNTLTSDPVPDQSTIEIATTDTVQREATTMPVLDLGWVSDGLLGEPMDIPAGEAEVTHATSAGFDSLFLAQARRTLGLAEDANLVLHNANHHMHELGTHQRTEIRHADGSSTCVLDIPEWDFAWQGSYTRAEPLTIRPGDTLWMGCTWDNSASNQPVIEGQVKEPADVAWGEGTSDEMCLGAYYVTSE